MAKYLSEAGLALYDAKIRERLGKKADAEAVPTKASQLENDAGYVTAADLPEGAAASATMPKMDGAATPGGETAFARGDHVHPTDATRLAVDGDGSRVTVGFTPADACAAIESGDTLAVIAGKVAKYLADLGALAFKNGVSQADLDEAVRASLMKADTALQGYTETDPTVPAWAKAADKPSYTAAEVGAIPAEQAEEFARKSDLSSVYKYKGSVAAAADLPADGNEAGDVWNVETTDMNYGWTGSGWDPLGQLFTIEAITSAEIDAIVNG